MFLISRHLFGLIKCAILLIQRLHTTFLHRLQRSIFSHQHVNLLHNALYFICVLSQFAMGICIPQQPRHTHRHV